MVRITVRKKEEKEKLKREKEEALANLRAAEEKEAEKTSLSARDPAREELRQKQLREDPLFAEKLRIAQERAGIFVTQQAEAELITPEQRRNVLLAEQIGELTGTPTGEFQPSELAGTRQTRLVALQGAAEAAISKGLTFGATAATGALVLGQLGPQVAAPEELVTVPGAFVVGGAIGIVTGGIQGYIDARSGSIKSQAEGFVGAKAKTLRSTKTVMTRSLSNAWGGRGDKEDALIMFMKNWNDALDAWGQLQVDTQNDVQLRRGVDGTTTLQMYLEFFKVGGQGQQFKDELDLALVSAPDLERSIFWTTQADINQLTPLPE